MSVERTIPYMDELYQNKILIFGFEDDTGGKSCMLRVTSKATTEKTTERLVLATLYCKDTCKLHETNTCVRISDACYRKNEQLLPYLVFFRQRKVFLKKTMQYVNNLIC